MTKDDLLALLLATADHINRVFDLSEIAAWPPGAFEDFKRLGLLREAAGGLKAPCPNCPDGHVEPVEIRTGSDGCKRCFIHCPEALRVEVSPEMCRGWEIDPGGLASAAGAAMTLKGSPKAVVPGRLWRLGRIPWEGKTREVVFARRLGDADAATIVAHIGPGGRSIVLVPHQTPNDGIWRGRTPAVVALSRIATFEHGQLVIDGVALMESVAEADALAESRSVLPIDPELKKQVIRQQVKAEIKGHLEDDVLIAARLTYGSTRKAATALTTELGRPISKDQIQRAIRRAGGLKALMELADSPSAARTVASRSCDRQKKFLERR